MTFKNFLQTLYIVVLAVVDVKLYNELRNYDGMRGEWIFFNIVLFVVCVITTIVVAAHILEHSDR